MIPQGGGLQHVQAGLSLAAVKWPSCPFLQPSASKIRVHQDHPPIQPQRSTLWMGTLRHGAGEHICNTLGWWPRIPRGLRTLASAQPAPRPGEGAEANVTLLPTAVALPLWPPELSRASRKGGGSQMQESLPFGLEACETWMSSSGCPTSPSPVSQSQKEPCFGSCFLHCYAAQESGLASLGPGLPAVSEGLIPSPVLDSHGF